MLSASSSEADAGEHVLSEPWAASSTSPATVEVHTRRATGWTSCVALLHGTGACAFGLLPVAGVHSCWPSEAPSRSPSGVKRPCGPCEGGASGAGAGAGAGGTNETGACVPDSGVGVHTGWRARCLSITNLDIERAACALASSTRCRPCRAVTSAPDGEQGAILKALLGWMRALLREV